MWKLCDSLFPSTWVEDLAIADDRITAVKSHWECSSFQKESRHSTWVLSVIHSVDKYKGLQRRESSAEFNPRPVQDGLTISFFTNKHNCLLHQRNQWWTPSPSPTCIRSWRVILGPVRYCQIPATENSWSSSGTNHRSLARMCIFKKCVRFDDDDWETKK